MNTGKLDALVTAEYIATRLAVPVSWVREHTRSGAIPHVRLGRWVRYSVADVDVWVDECKAGGGPAFRRHNPSRAIAGRDNEA